MADGDIRVAGGSQLARAVAGMLGLDLDANGETEEKKKKEETEFLRRITTLQREQFEKLNAELAQDIAKLDREIADLDQRIQKIDARLEEIEKLHTESDRLFAEIRAVEEAREIIGEDGEYTSEEFNQIKALFADHPNVKNKNEGEFIDWIIAYDVSGRNKEATDLAEEYNEAEPERLSLEDAKNSLLQAKEAKESERELKEILQKKVQQALEADDFEQAQALEAEMQKAEERTQELQEQAAENLEQANSILGVTVEGLEELDSGVDMAINNKNDEIKDGARMQVVQVAAPSIDQF